MVQPMSLTTITRINTLTTREDSRSHMVDNYSISCSNKALLCSGSYATPIDALRSINATPSRLRFYVSAAWCVPTTLYSSKLAFYPHSPFLVPIYSAGASLHPHPVNTHPRQLRSLIEYVDTRLCPLHCASSSSLTLLCPATHLTTICDYPKRGHCIVHQFIPHDLSNSSV